MHVAYIGNFRPEWSTENDVARALEANGVTLYRLQEDDLDWRELPTRIDGADLLLWTRTWALDKPAQHEGLEGVRDRQIPIVGYHLDRWWGLGREHQIRDEPFFRYVDLLCTADGGHEAEWQAAGIRHRWTPPAVSAIHLSEVGHPRRNFASDVCFVGNWSHYHPEWAYRRELVNRLSRRYRQRFQFWPKGRGNQIRGPQLTDLYASAKVIVGDSCLVGDAVRYWSDRIPETLGRGGFLIHPDVEGLELHYTPGDHLATYHLGDFDGLFSTIDAFLADPAARAEIAAAGKAHVAEHHTYERRIADLLDWVGSNRLVVPLVDAEGDVLLHYRNLSAQATLRPPPAVRGRECWDGRVADEIWRQNVYHTPEAMTGVAVDLGAHIGLWTLFALAAGAAHVHAYEPDGGPRERLGENVAANGWAERVSVWPEAVTADFDGADLIVPIDTSAARLSHTGAGVPVPTVDLAEVIRRAGGHVDYLKADIEGAEYRIDWSAEALARIDSIALEFEGCGDHPEKAGPGEFGRLVTQLAAAGHLEVLGRPEHGGYIWWRRYRT